MNIRIEAHINATEQEQCLLDAIASIFPTIGFYMEDDSFVGTSCDLCDLSKLKELIETQSIRDAARKSIRKGRRGSGLTIHLNRQAATAGKINFSDECPMGPISVRIVGDFDEICDYLAPSTI